MDQRGTGHSSPITVANLSAKGSASEQVDHLKCFRQACSYSGVLGQATSHTCRLYPVHTPALVWVRVVQAVYSDQI